MTSQYMGIIDTDGLDMFAKIEPREAIMEAFATGEMAEDPSKKLNWAVKARALSNQQRHPIIFICELKSEDVELMEGCDSLLKAQIILRNSKEFAIARSYPSTEENWKILKKLVPEYKGEYSGERYTPRSIKDAINN